MQCWLFVHPADHRCLLGRSGHSLKSWLTLLPCLRVLKGAQALSDTTRHVDTTRPVDTRSLLCGQTSAYQSSQWCVVSLSIQLYTLQMLRQLLKLVRAGVKGLQPHDVTHGLQVR